MTIIYDYMNDKSYLELGFSCKDIKNITNKDIICCDLKGFEERLVNNSDFRNDFFKYIIYNKNIINLRLKNYALDYLKLNDKVNSDFVKAIKTWQRLYNTEDSFNFSASIFDLYDKNELIPLFSIIFITTEDISNIILDCKKLLESDKDCLNEDEYMNCLKEEFISALKEIGY